MNGIRLIRPRPGSVIGPRPGFPSAPEENAEAPGAPSWDPNAGPVPAEGADPRIRDRSLPDPARFEWRRPAGCRGALVYELLISRNGGGLGADTRVACREPSCSVYHLHVGARYRWKVVARDPAGRRAAESPEWAFSTRQAPPRWIRVPGITNVRDIGGWTLPGGRRIRQGLLYRSSEMNGHVKIAEAGRRVFEDELGIRTDLDLRGSGEDPRPVLDPSVVRWVNIPVRGYGHIVEAPWRRAYKRIFNLLARRSRYPLVFHCWGGADRGGTLAFLLQALLGMRRADLLRDYEMTSLSLWGCRTRRSEYFKGLLRALRSFGPPGASLSGQAEAYLLDIGVTPDVQAAIRGILVEPRAARRAGPAGLSTR